MNSNKINDEKRLLLNDLINVTREISTKYNGGKQLVTEERAEVEKLLILLERFLCFGLKNSILGNVQDLFSSSSSSNGSLFWSFAYQHLTKHEQERFSSYKNVSGSISDFLRFYPIKLEIVSAVDGSRENEGADKKRPQRALFRALSSDVALRRESQRFLRAVRVATRREIRSDSPEVGARSQLDSLRHLHRHSRAERGVEQIADIKTRTHHRRPQLQQSH